MASSSDSDRLRNALNMKQRRYANLLNRFGDDGSDAREAGIKLINMIADRQEQLEQQQQPNPEPTNNILPLLQQQTNAINNLILATSVTPGGLSLPVELWSRRRTIVLRC